MRPGYQQQQSFGGGQGPYGHHMQHRQMSGSFQGQQQQQMTPRQQQALPQHVPSPGMPPAGQPDEGK